jgi:glycosyltransferase involved in cell wall biosynthesis
MGQSPVREDRAPNLRPRPECGDPQRRTQPVVAGGRVRLMRVCVISFKDCWRDESGRWLSYGGFPLQMEAIASLFDEMTMLVVEGRPREGGLALPARARVVPLREPSGADLRRKLSVLTHLPYYVGHIARGVRQADVVHVPLPGDLPFLGLLTALLLRRKLLARYGSSWSRTRQTTLMNRVTQFCMRRFAGGRNVMLATGDGDEPPAPGMDWVFATALSADELRRGQVVLDRELAAPPRLVYIGRLAPEKGVRNLVHAAALLKRERCAVLPQLALVGDGPERGALEKEVCQVGCQELIRFTGQLNRDDLARELQQADVCVQPSLTEGFSKAWLDAMAQGLPVLATAVGAARAVIGGDGERGWLVPPGDVPALAAALRRALTATTDWPALRRRCRAYVEGRTLEAWAARIGRICAQQWGMSFVQGKLAR